MATIKQVQRERLKMYLECEAAILAGQEYQIGSRKMVRADLAEVREMIEDLIDAGVTLEDEPIRNGRYRRAVFV